MNTRDQVEGSIEFESFSNIPFRFRIGKDDIWIEDKKSKAQWECKVKDIATFAMTKGVTLPQDYVMNNLMVVMKHKSNNESFVGDVDLIEGKEQKLVLVFDLEVGNKEALTSLQYRFILDKIPLERLDILEAKMRDFEEFMQKINKKPSLYKLKSSKATTGRQYVNWNGNFSSPDEGNALSIDTSDTSKILIHKAGTYQFVNISNHCYNNDYLSIYKNGHDQGDVEELQLSAGDNIQLYNNYSRLLEVQLNITLV